MSTGSHPTCQQEMELVPCHANSEHWRAGPQLNRHTATDIDHRAAMLSGNAPFRNCSRKIRISFRGIDVITMYTNLDKMLLMAIISPHDIDLATAWFLTKALPNKSYGNVSSKRPCTRITFDENTENTHRRLLNDATSIPSRSSN